MLQVETTTRKKGAQRELNIKQPRRRRIQDRRKFAAYLATKNNSFASFEHEFLILEHLTAVLVLSPT